MRAISTSVLITLTVLAFLPSTEAQTAGSNYHEMALGPCRIQAVDSNTASRRMGEAVKKAMTLIEYKLTFINYSNNPMTTNVTRYYKADTWARVKMSTNHGQTLLSLAFNYGVLSLMTLTFRTTSMKIELEDIPSGCIGELPEKQKVEMVQQLVMRDFEKEGNVPIVEEEKVCNVQIMNQSGYANFIYHCCFVDKLKETKDCELNDANWGLHVLLLMLTVVRVGILFLGPLLFVSTIAKLVNQEISYVVKLREPLKKTILLSTNEDRDRNRFKAKRRVNLENISCHKLPKLMKSLCKKFKYTKELEGQKPFSCFIYDYHILVNYKRLLVENEVPIGFWKLMLNAVFFCELRDIGPFVDCCKQKLCSCIPWIKFWKAVGLVLLVLLLPMPYYLRLLIFYNFEQDEVISRKEAATRMGLRQSFENSILHSFPPTHPVFLSIYCIYFTMAIIFAFASKMKENPLQKIIVGSFDDLHNLSLFGVLHMMVSNVIWPFEKFGAFSIFIVFIYWPIALPITCLISVGYFLPTIYLTIRMLFYSETSILERFKSGFVAQLERSQQLFEIKTIWKFLFPDSDVSNNDRKSNDPVNGKDVRTWLKSTFVADSEIDKMKTYNPKIVVQQSNSTNTPALEMQNWKSRCCNIAVHTCASTLCVVAMYSILIILSECIGCLTEIIVFTMMGIIVNSDALLKYVTLALLIIVYIYDSLNNVEKKYLQLNKALFKNVRKRVKGVEEVTSLPEELQENTAFKSQELSEQGDHEESDDVAKEPSRHWFINDLVLFVDKEDVPRIPKKLFEEVCEIQVAGVPGPVYMGLLSAFKSFIITAIFVMFVFLAIVSFGEAYGLSSMGQTLAALAGGSVPLLFKTFIKPPKPDIDTGTVSFKSKLDEVVMNFYQFWPMNDFSFELQPQKKEEESADKDAPTESANPVADSEIYINEVKTAAGIPGILMIGPIDRRTTKKKEKSQLTKLLRKEKRREDVDILIILPNDFNKELWNDVWTKFCTKDNSKKDETAVPVYARGSHKTRFRKSKARPSRRRKETYGTDDVPEEEEDEEEDSVEIRAASVQA